MATRILGPTGSRRRRRFLVGPVLLIAIVGLMLIGGAQGAPDDNGLFELDANVIDSPAGPPDDWSNIFAGTDSAFTDTGIVADPAPQSIFTGGGSKDHEEISQWKHKNGSVPDKDDIVDAYAAAYTQGGDTFVYFGMDRFSTLGSSNVGFWFLQDDVAPIPGTPAGSTSTFAGEHEVGDILVLSEFSDGGTGISIKVFEWVGTGGDEGGGTLQTLFGGEDGAPADCDDTGVAATVCANVNTSPILDANIPWNYIGKGGSRDMPTASFFEGGINLSALLPDEPCITSMVAETRASFEVNAVLKDLVAANFSLCDADISIAPDDVNDVGDPHTFTVNVSTTVAGNPTPAPDGTIVDVTLTHSNPAGVVDLISDTCASPGTVGGTCTVTFDSDEPGTITGHAEADVTVGDATIHVETGGTGNNPNAVKRFVDAKIAVSPLLDTNGISETHTVTVDVEQDLGDGAGFVAATVGHVDVQLTDSSGAISQVDASTTCHVAAAHTGGPDNLNASGQCIVVFTSAVTGTVTVNADVELVLTTTEGTVTLTRSTDGTGNNSGDAVKNFVDGSLAWFKNDDQGARLGGATFQVCRTHNLDTSTTPDTFVLLQNPVCVTVLDNSAPDTDLEAGEFKLEDLLLGRYTVDEIPPFPPGYEPDPDVVTVNLTLEPGPKDATISEAFVNRALYKLIVITCNTTTEALVDSTVTLSNDNKETLKASQLPQGLTEATVCGLAGANYDNLTRGTYTPSVELPDVPPLFPSSP